MNLQSYYCFTKKQKYPKLNRRGKKKDTVFLLFYSSIFHEYCGSLSPSDRGRKKGKEKENFRGKKGKRKKK